jgi:hypothetical protein
MKILFLQEFLHKTVTKLLVKTIRFIPHTFMCEPMGREIFITFLLLVETKGHFNDKNNRSFRKNFG